MIGSSSVPALRQFCARCAPADAIVATADRLNLSVPAAARPFHVARARILPAAPSASSPAHAPAKQFTCFGRVHGASRRRRRRYSPTASPRTSHFNRALGRESLLPGKETSFATSQPAAVSSLPLSGTAAVRRGPSSRYFDDMTVYASSRACRTLLESAKPVRHYRGAIFDTPLRWARGALAAYVHACGPLLRVRRPPILPSTRVGYQASGLPLPASRLPSRPLYPQHRRLADDLLATLIASPGRRARARATRWEISPAPPGRANGSALRGSQ